MSKEIWAGKQQNTLKSLIHLSALMTSCGIQQTTGSTETRMIPQEI